MTGAMRILLVEDDRKVASFIARALRENTYAVDVAESGQKALELGVDVPYDAILLDVRWPDLSGIEVCRELRQRGIESPVMMLTARGLVEQRGRRLGCRCRRLSNETFRSWRNSLRVCGRWFGGLPQHQREASLRRPYTRPSPPRATRDKETIPLTSREFALLELLLLRAPELITRSEIVEHVWDCPLRQRNKSR